MEGNWEVLAFDSDYEIFSEFPYPIRRKGSDKIVSECIDGEYYRMKINGKKMFKHRLIAFQWIHNDDPTTKTQIDHINREKLDNRIENLRWVTPSENNKNRPKMIRRCNDYIEELPENAIQISDFDGIKLDRYYYDIDNERLIMEMRFKQVKYKIVHPSLHRNQLVLNLVDDNGKQHNRSYNKLINQLKTVL